ncbi:ku70 ku80 beta-barrel domain-containing protein, partial [Cystoisospora suis]
MALPGQSFKRVVVLVLDCGATMQQRIRGNPPIDNYAGEFETASSSVDSAASARTSSLSSASVSTTASSLHHAAPGVHSHRTHTAGNWDSETDEPVTSNTSAFAVMKRAALEYVQRLAATSARTDVGVVCFGGARTNNSLMDLGDQEGGADGGYRNVEEACKPEAASWKAVRAVEEAECSNAKSDAVDGIVVAVNMVEKQYGPKLAQNDVCFLLFSDCRATLADSDDVLPVLEHLNHLGIRVQLILVDGSFGCSTSTLRLPLQSSDESVCRQLPAFEPLAQLCTTLIPIKSFLASPAVRLFSPPLKRLSTKCRVNLTISSGFQIPVYVFVKVRKENLPTVRKRVFLGVQSAAGRTRIRSPSSASDSSDALQSPSKGETGDLLWRDLRVHRFYFRANDPDRNPVRLADQKSQAKFPWLSEHGEKSDNGGTPDVKGGRGESGESVQRLHAYRYGKQLVAVTSIEQEALKEKTVAGLVALGVARLDDIQR